jgi:hypothetical protein
MIKNRKIKADELVDLLLIMIDMIEHPEQREIYHDAMLEHFKNKAKGNFMEQSKNNIIDGVRCYGEMNLSQNTWFVTDDSDEEFVFSNGYESFEEAIEAIRKAGHKPVEVMGV